MSKPFNAHPLAEQSPLMQGSEFDELVASIKADGLKEPITLYEGMILDGRNRYRACRAAGIIPRFVEFAGSNPAKFVAEKNVLRRHLTPSQRAMFAAKLATAQPGRPRENGSSVPPLSKAEAAEVLGVSEQSVKHAKRVRAKGTAALQKAVEDDNISVSAAAKIAGLPEEEQAEQVAKCTEAVTKESRDERPPRFKSKRATILVNRVEAVCKLFNEIEPDDFEREYMAEFVEDVNVWWYGVKVAQDAADAAELDALSPAEALRLSWPKMSPEDQEAVLKAMRARL